MYVYKKKRNLKKVYVVSSMALMLVAGIVSWQFVDTSDKTLPVSKEELVITLPDQIEKGKLPFLVEAKVVLEYFDGENHEVKDYTNLNGVYRPNQGMDYNFNDENFEVISMMSGEVVEIKKDELFGNSVTIQSGDVKIIYQSLESYDVKVNNKVKQGDFIGKAGKNTYNPELGNHLHLIVIKKGVLMDPKMIVGKSLKEI